MNLQDLITKLESAAELATDGEIEVDPDLYGYGFGVFGVFLNRNPIKVDIASGIETEGDAQAIAIRHNTASDVLRELHSFVRTSAATIESNTEAVRRLVEFDEIRDVQHGEVIAAVAKLKSDHSAEVAALKLRAEKAEANFAQLKATIRAHTSEELTAVMDRLARKRIKELTTKDPHAMSTEYEEGHPLYGQTAEWIAEAAERRSEFLSRSYEDLIMPESVALAHEYKRLKAEAEGVHPFGNHGTVGHVWLTRAITLSGAPEGSDWAGLLDYLSQLKGVCDDYLDSMGELRERAESAETKIAELIAAKERSWDMQEGMRRDVLKRLEVSELRVAELQAKVKDGDERNSENWQRIDRLEAELKMSTQNPGLLARYVKIGNAGDLESMLDSYGELVAADLERREDASGWTDVPTTPPLDRIAAALESQVYMSGGIWQQACGHFTNGASPESECRICCERARASNG